MGNQFGERRRVQVLWRKRYSGCVWKLYSFIRFEFFKLVVLWRQRGIYDRMLLRYHWRFVQFGNVPGAKPGNGRGSR